MQAQFAYEDKGCFVNAPSPMIVPGNKYVLAVLNSKVGDWYIRQLGVTRNGGYFEYKPMFIERFPIPQVSPLAREKFIALVDQIHDKKNAEQDTSLDKKELDQMVFDLYGLDESETAFILAR